MLLALAGPARAADVLVVRNAMVAGAEQGHRQALEIIHGALDVFGASYDGIPHGTAKTEFCRLGVQSWGFDGSTGRSTSSYKLVIHAGWTYNLLTAGYRPESLMFAAKWPLVPQIFVGDINTRSGKWADAASCSSGIRSSTPYTDLTATHAQYLVGEPEVWHTDNATRIAANQAAGGWYARGIWRPIVGIGVSASNHADALPLNTSACTDCDSVGRQVSPDSVSVWMRLRYEGDPAPLIFVEIGGSPGGGDPMLFAMALGAADKAIRLSTGKGVITKQAKMSIVVDGIYNTSPYYQFTSLDTLAQGIFVRPDSSDIQNLEATQDSLDELSTRLGFPIHYTADAESMLVAADRTALIRRVRNHRIMVNSYTGTREEPGVFNAGRYRLLDIFGHARSRTVLPVGATDVPATCADTDTGSIYCLYKWALARAESIFGADRVDRTLVPAYGDWTPTTVTRANTQPAYDLMWALNSLGCRGAVASLYSADNAVSRSTLPRGPLGLEAQTASYTTRKPGSTGGPTGRFRLMATRGSDIWNAADPWGYAPGPHIIRTSEELVGFFRGAWYLPHIAFHPSHNEQARTIVMHYNAQLLGGSGQGTRASRTAWWYIKHTANQVSAINKLAGRPVIRIVPLDELAAE